MKRCPVCRTEKSEDCFSKNKTTKDGLHYKCKECSSAYFRSWYEKNPGHRDSVLAGLRAKRAARQRIVIDFLRKHPCIDCDEGDVIVLEFDHKNPDEKSMEVSRLITCAKSEKELIDEMQKCEVRCANCHRRKTAKQFKTYRFLEGTEVGSSTGPENQSAPMA